MKLNLAYILYPLFLLAIVLISNEAFCQTTISGTVYDSSKLYVVPGVKVFSSSGNITETDSLGNYKIAVSTVDSIRFFYKDKYTVKFPLNNIDNYNSFDISLRVHVDGKYKLLKKVTVFSNSYLQDSLENRAAYSAIFGDTKPTFQSSHEVGGPAGIDLNSLIGIFQFKKNKHRLAFRNRLIMQEQDRYVDYRFSSKTVSRITGLEGEGLLQYKKLYRPSYDFVSQSSLTQFYRYILNTSYQFKKIMGIE